MVSGKVTVSFKLFIGSELELDEEEINAKIDIYRSQLRSRNRYDGAIIISYSCQPIVQLEDELPAIIKNFCFEAIPDLISGKNVVVGYYDHYGDIRLNLEASNIVISGDDISTITIPSSQLLPALYSCGQRFICFLICLKGNTNDSVLENLIHFLEDIGEVSRQALANYDLSN